MPSADCYLYLPDTTTLVTGLVNEDGVPISNPFAASLIGQVQFGAPNGVYDLRIARGVRDTTIRIQCADLLQSINEIGAFLGPHASAPATRADGSPLQLADRYLNTTDQLEYLYKSSGWVANNIVGEELAEPEGAGMIGAYLQDGSESTVQEAISRGDENLRSSLAAPGGAAIVGAYLQSGTAATVQQAIDEAAKAVGENGSRFVGFNLGAINAIERTVNSKAGETVSVKDFGAACDAVYGVAKTDDSAAFARAIEYCLSMDPPAQLVVPGLCQIDNPVLLERLVDSPNANSRFIIKGSGPAAGLYCHYGVTAFTAFPENTDVWVPQSQKIQFQELSFLSLAPTNPTWLLEGRRFLDVNVVNCSFWRMRLARNEAYYQSWTLLNCSAFGYTGTFMEGTGGCYDIHFLASKFQAGGKVFDVTQNQAHGLDQCSFYMSHNHFQAMSAAAITADCVMSAGIDNNYFEFTQGSINLDTANNLANLSPNHSVSISSNLFAQTEENRLDPNYFDVRWGRTSHGTASSNYVATETIGAIGTKLHKITDGLSRVVLMGEPGFSLIYTTDTVAAMGGYIQPGSGEALRTLRGKVSADGAITRGAGFTSEKISTGKYRITFTPIYLDEPSLIAMPLDSTGTAISGMDTGEGAVGASVVIQFRDGASAIDTPFYFIAVGVSS